MFKSLALQPLSDAHFSLVRLDTVPSPPLLFSLCFCAHSFPEAWLLFCDFCRPYLFSLLTPQTLHFLKISLSGNCFSEYLQLKQATREQYLPQSSSSQRHIKGGILSLSLPLILQEGNLTLLLKSLYSEVNGLEKLQIKLVLFSLTEV